MAHSAFTGMTLWGYKSLDPYEDIESTCVLICVPTSQNGPNLSRIRKTSRHA